MIAINIRPRNGLGTQQNTTYNACYTSKLQDYIGEGLIFQNLQKSQITHADLYHLLFAMAQN